VKCDVTSGTCQVKVPAPSFALVFLTDNAFSAVSPHSTLTFPTTAVTRTFNTVFINPFVLAHSNGDYGMQDKTGRTSFRSSNSALSMKQPWPGSLAFACLAAILVTLW
jgi:hypothetical protein